MMDNKYSEIQKYLKLKSIIEENNSDEIIRKAHELAMQKAKKMQEDVKNIK